MKKTLLTITALFAIINFTACSSKDDVYKPNTIEGECIIKSEVAPVWVCGGYEDPLKYTAVGSAEYSKLGHNFSRNEAILNARTNLVNQVKLDIKARAESYMRSSGLSENEKVERVVTQVSKQTSSLTLKDSKQISYWQSTNDNTIYVLVAVSKDSTSKLIDENVKDVVDNQLQILNSEDALNNL